MAESKIPASFTVAQACLESGWGTHAPGFNLFGIKSTPDWVGPTTTLATHEVVNGHTVTVEASFRAYPDWLASLRDHAAFLTDNPRYTNAFNFTDGADFAQAIQACGYATDPHYAEKIISIIDVHNLSVLDA